MARPTSLFQPGVSLPSQIARRRPLTASPATWLLPQRLSPVGQKARCCSGRFLLLFLDFGPSQFRMLHLVQPLPLLFGQRS